MPVLLVSLGVSPAIVPEAFLLRDVEFSAVHVLTTESTSVEFVLNWFTEEAPGVEISVTRVAGFTDFKSEREHFLFEEVLYRWYLENCPGPERPYVCLSGGFKTMSAAVQKAASVLGAAEVFHVLADSVYPDPKGGASKMPASTPEQIKHSCLNGHLHWIKLGPESGWPQMRGIEAANFPLLQRERNDVVCLVEAPDHRFRDHLHHILERSHNIASAWKQVGDLPFPILATWPEQALTWLNDPVDPKKDAEWLAKLPKIELHCHLGGFATHGKALQSVRDAAERPEELPPLTEPALPPGWPSPESPVSLVDYMELGDATGSALLKDGGCLRRQCQLLYEHLYEENVRYAEIRCSPANYATSDRSPWTVLSDIKAAFDDCMKNHPKGCRVNLLLIATRKEKGDYRTAISRHLSLAVTAAEHWQEPHGCRVVGVDLAGYEDITTRAHYFREEFTAVHRCGLALTVHAGENDDAEGIWSAVFNLNARRLGHALHLIDSPELMRSVADRGVAVEMCPCANYQIKGFSPMPGKQQYPLKRYLDAGVRVTINTDNIGISSAGLTKNILFASLLCPELTRMDVLRLQAHSLESSFLTPSLRVELRSSLESMLTIP